MQQGMDLLHQGMIEVLGNTIQLRCVMNSQVMDSTSSCKVLVKGSAQVLASSVRAKCVYDGTVLLCASPGLEGPIAVQGVALVGEEVDYHKMGHIIREGDKVAAPSMSRYG